MDLIAKALSALTAITPLLTLVGLFLVVRQLRHAERVRTLETQTQLVMHSFSILQHINSTDSAYGFVFGGKDLSPTSSDLEKATADLTAQMILDLFEHACLQIPTLKPETASAWKAWIGDVFKGSSSIQTYYAARTHWYSVALRELLDPALEAAQAKAIQQIPQ